MDTLTYTKQGDGSFTKVVTHIEILTDLDSQILAAQTTVNSISIDVQNLQSQIKLKQTALEQAKSALDALSNQEDTTVATKKTYTEETPNIDVSNEVAVIEATISNLQAGTSKDADVQQAIDEQVSNLQDCLDSLKS